MITKEEFVKLINDYIKWEARIEEVSDVFGGNLFEVDWVEYTSYQFEDIIKILFNEFGVDTIFWWVFEKRLNPELKIYEEDVEITCDTVEDLYEIVKTNLK